VPKIFALIFLLGYFASSCNTKLPSSIEKEHLTLDYAPHVEEIKEYSKFKKFSEDFALLIDMSKRSGLNRIFLYDLKADTVVLAGLCAHGHGKNYARIHPKFSNDIGSNCSSLGRYKIGAKYNGTFGTAYKLHGLDSTNSNAFKRFVVLHAHDCVPDEERLAPICRSEGCPTVSPKFLKMLEPYLDKSRKPITLMLFDN
jgi:hypothetical protein